MLPQFIFFSLLFIFITPISVAGTPRRPTRSAGHLPRHNVSLRPRNQRKKNCQPHFLRTCAPQLPVRKFAGLFSLNIVFIFVIADCCYYFRFVYSILITTFFIYCNFFSVTSTMLFRITLLLFVFVEVCLISVGVFLILVLGVCSCPPRSV